MTLWDLFKKQPVLEPLKTSPGKIRLYLQCPLKYQYQHVDNVKVEKSISPHLSFHSIVKNAIDEYQKRIAVGGTDIAADTLRDLISKNWDPGQFPQGENDNFYQQAMKTADAMTEWFANHKALTVTHRNEPAIGVFAPWLIHPVTIWTRLDRIERKQDGALQLIIFKSGSRQLNPKEFAVDMGMRLQAAAAIELLGKELDTVSIVYLRTGDTYQVKVSSMSLGDLGNEVLDLAGNIQRGNFEPVTGPLCSVCEYLEMCSAWKSPPWKSAGETRLEYSRRLRLSYSKMSLFERCPRAYKKLYLEKIPPKPQPFFSFGSCIHAVMESFYDGTSKSVRTLDHLKDLLDRKWADFCMGYNSEDEENLYRNRAVTMLEKYYQSFVSGRKFQPAYAIESYFEIPVGDLTVMTGFIDRIDKMKSKKFIIYDYKTEPTARSQESVDADLQLTLYYWAAREFLKMDITELGLFMMSHDQLLTTSRTPLEIPILLERIQNTTRKILDEKHFEPNMNKYCLSCDHLAGCPLESSIRNRTDLRTMEFLETDSE